jgi:hypothetical protein
MTDGQSASLPWNKAPIWGLCEDFYYCQTLAGLLMWDFLSDERRVCRLQLLLAFTRAVILGSESRGTRDPILLGHIRDFHFRRLLRLAGQWWRYSTQPPNGKTHLVQHWFSYKGLLWNRCTSFKFIFILSLSRNTFLNLWKQAVTVLFFSKESSV